MISDELICAHCRHRNPSGRAICSKCGRPLSIPAPLGSLPASRLPRKPSRAKIKLRSWLPFLLAVVTMVFWAWPSLTRGQLVPKPIQDRRFHQAFEQWRDELVNPPDSEYPVVKPNIAGCVRAVVPLERQGEIRVVVDEARWRQLDDISREHFDDYCGRFWLNLCRVYKPEAAAWRINVVNVGGHIITQYTMGDEFTGS